MNRSASGRNARDRGEAVRRSATQSEKYELRIFACGRPLLGLSGRLFRYGRLRLGYHIIAGGAQYRDINGCSDLIPRNLDRYGDIIIISDVLHNLIIFDTYHDTSDVDGVGDLELHQD